MEPFGWPGELPAVWARCERGCGRLGAQLGTVQQQEQVRGRRPAGHWTVATRGRLARGDEVPRPSHPAAAASATHARVPGRSMRLSACHRDVQTQMPACAKRTLRPPRSWLDGPGMFGGELRLAATTQRGQSTRGSPAPARNHAAKDPPSAPPHHHSAATGPACVRHHCERLVFRAANETSLWTCGPWPSLGVGPAMRCGVLQACSSSAGASQASRKLAKPGVTANSPSQGRAKPPSFPWPRWRGLGRANCPSWPGPLAARARCRGQMPSAKARVCEFYLASP